MTSTDGHRVLPPGVLAHNGRDLPDGLSFTAHALAVQVPTLPALPALLLIPQFTAEMTDDTGTYSPLPYMLSAEGFYEMDNGVPVPREPEGVGAGKQGWGLRRRKDDVEVSRRHKILYRGPFATVLTAGMSEETWRQSVALNGGAVVLVAETDPGPVLPELVAAQLNGSWVLLPSRGF